MRLNQDARTIIVTGGSRGIGSAISSAFYEGGDKVLIASRTDTGLAKHLGQRARFIKVDLRYSNGAKEVIQAALDWTGRVDVLVNNTGISAWKPLAEISDDFVENMLSTNLKSMIYMCQAVAPHLKVGGTIVNISSLAGKRGSANNSVYCATKFGVNGLTQSLAKELGQQGIRVNAVCPVYIQTEGLEVALKETVSPTLGLNTEDYLATFAKTQSALGVLPTAKQIASACVFLASSSASAITGQCINIDCGVMPQ
jgi:3-oxoacyl-[acyl-carrier protein] reductase/meso-butanediol dehydrogenase/(S,S)-butanediol dehydrogenase/diacetyl reductase